MYNLRLKCNSGYMKDLKKIHDNFICYPENINILHLIIYHNINIDKLLLFLITRYYNDKFYNPGFYFRKGSDQNNYPCENEYPNDNDKGEQKLIKLYIDVINSATKFDKYNFDFTQDYETLFLDDYENIDIDKSQFEIVNREINIMKRIYDEKFDEYNDKICNLEIENNELKEIIKEINNKINSQVELNDNVKKLQNQIEVYRIIVNDKICNLEIENNELKEIIKEINNKINIQVELNDTVKKLQIQIEVYRIIVNNLVEKINNES
jgi:hypothetical protein